MSPHFLIVIMNNTKPYTVLLYYKYVPVPDLETTVYDHLNVCKALNLLGRIYIAKEGINGTCAGHYDDIKKYMKYMKGHPLFQGTEFKLDYAAQNPFRKLFVRTRPEIVASDLDPTIDPLRDTGRHLSPQAFHEMLQKEDDYVLLDMRNTYESAIGKFEQAIPVATENFRDLPKVMDQFADYKDKKVLMYCTGGIRCEKASAYFKREGFKDVYQLHGGIINYAAKIPKEERLFKGKCFVFDDRLAVPITDDVLTTCHHCGTASDRYLNCTNLTCNELFLCCDSCRDTHNHACSAECAKHPRNEWKRPDPVY